MKWMMCDRIYTKRHENSSVFQLSDGLLRGEARTGMLARCFGETMLRGLGETKVGTGLVVMEVNEQQLYMWQLIRLYYSYWYRN